MESLIIVAILWFISRTFVIVPAHQNIVKERLGRFEGVLQPGPHLMVPLIDRSAYVHEIREQAIDIPPQMCITKDNIQVSVDGVVFLKVIDAKRASYAVGNYRLSAINLAQTTMRAEVGKLNLDQTFSSREKINDNIIREIDKATETWGIKVTRYEVKDLSPSPRVIETMEKQMEAERQKRASITVSSGQKEAKILISEGMRQEAVNMSEGERQKRINEAEGRAGEIRILANANATAASLVAEAIRSPGGNIAVNMQMMEQYLGEMGKVLSEAKVTMMPSSIAGIKTALDGLSALTHPIQNETQPGYQPPPLITVSKKGKG